MDLKIKLHANLDAHTQWEDDVAPKTKTMEFFKGNSDSEIHVFTDQSLPTHTNIKNKIKVAWLREIVDVFEYACVFQEDPYNPYEYLSENIEHFDYVIAPIDYKYFKDIINKDRFIFCPEGGTRVKPENWGLYEKSKMLSIVASNKDWTIGHRLRHWVINSYKPQIDIYGNGYNNIIDSVEGGFGKIYALAPYYFHFVILNSKKDGWYTEALIDAFACGCIPIFFGCKDIGNHFNTDGIIQFESIPQLKNIIKNLSPELYQSKIEAVKENLEIAKSYRNYYDYTYDNHLDDFKKMTKK